VNIDRQRNLDFTFHNKHKELIYARLVYDTPAWDSDSLHIWKRSSSGEPVKLLEEDMLRRTEPHSKSGLHKIKSFINSIVEYIESGVKPEVAFCDKQQTIFLHKIIERIYALAQNTPQTNCHYDIQRFITC